MKAVLKSNSETQLTSDLHEIDRQLASASSIYSITILQKRMRKVSNISSAESRRINSKVMAYQISKRWGISINSARETIKSNTQEHIRQAGHPLTRKFRTDLSTFIFRRLREKLSSDTAFMKTKSLEGDTCFQIFSSPCGFVQLHPMESKSETGDKLRLLTEYIDAPNEITTDGSQEKFGRNSDFHRRCKFIGCKMINS